MAPREWAALDIVGPVAPEREWSACRSIPVIEGSSGAPQRQKRAGDAPTDIAIRLIVREIERRRCAIFLADSVNTRRIAQRLDVGRAYLRAKYPGGRSPG